MADVPAYPVYMSPDGKTQVAATPRREVELRHAGWVKVSEPRLQAGDGRRTARRKSNE
ncbi:MAG TPA: hypothetical protein VF188_08005 [Longimicrobiales bacterium]